MITYSARLDVPRELVQHVARLLRAERRAVGTRRRTRALTCFYQALLVLVWFRKGEDKTTLAAGFWVSRATAYRYVAEAVRVLAAQTPTLHDALKQVAADGWSHVILDGKLFDTDRLAETTLSVKGDTIDAWYSGKHRDFGANIQAVMRPDGLPIWTADAMPGHLHDLTCAQELDITGALYRGRLPPAPADPG
ncbi:transposase family protein [Plantactinospora sp. KBS50]|uniref:transposase family protein n=1 Tax=Plantactinospora sp. KBS50 TaxID=2024580 RepID=UPI001E5BCBE8|nr:transposase family protein [Plantactinospora sp. KBS50]